MAMDPRIALAGVQPEFGLRGLMQGLQAGQQFRGNQLTLAAQGRQQAEEDALRSAFANRAAGLAGLAPQMGGGAAEGAVQERQLGGTPSAMAPYAQPPPGGPQAPQGLAGLGPQMQPGGGGAPGAPVRQERAFLDQLYSISPKGAMAYEKHLADQQRAAGEAQEAQMKGNVARVEFLGRVADGVLESGEPQKAWEVGRAMLIEQGMPPDQVPTVYDPSFVQQLSGMARDAKDRYNAGMLSLQQAKEQRERTQLAQAIPDYGLGDKLNAAVYAQHGHEIAPGQAPTPGQIQRGRARLMAEEREEEQAKQAGRVEVAAATGREAAQSKTMSETAQKRLEALDKAGNTAQNLHATLDEVERLIGEGVYGNSPLDRAAMAAFRAGTRPNDAKAARTARLQELGSQMQLAPGSLGAGVSVYDAQVYAKAYGNFQAPKSPKEMQESLKSMRTILNKAVDYANTARDTFEKTGKMPAFEGRKLTEQDITDTIAAGKASGRALTRQQVIDAAKGKGWATP